MPAAGEDDQLYLAIVDRATGAYVGEVVLYELDADNRSCVFRIALVGPRVFGCQATRLILAHAFDNVGAHRVELEVYAFNSIMTALARLDSHNARRVSERSRPGQSGRGAGETGQESRSAGRRAAASVIATDINIHATCYFRSDDD
jgi:hypothetical protein